MSVRQLTRKFKPGSLSGTRLPGSKSAVHTYLWPGLPSAERSGESEGACRLLERVQYCELLLRSTAGNGLRASEWLASGDQPTRALARQQVCRVCTRIQGTSTTSYLCRTRAAIWCTCDAWPLFQLLYRQPADCAVVAAEHLEHQHGTPRYHPAVLCRASHPDMCNCCLDVPDRLTASS